jgi:hypothetical protein
MPQLNAFDAAPGRTVVVTAGDLFEEAISVDLLVISAWENYYEGEPGSMVAVLRDRCGLEVKQLQESPALDLRAATTIRAWITPPLAELAIPPSWPEGSLTRFSRLAVVESPRNGLIEATDQQVFQQLFCLLSLLPLHGIQCNSVATPLLNTGRQKAKPEQLYPAMISAIGNGFRHVPELRQLVIFDKKAEPLQALCEKIDSQLNRTPLDYKPLELKEHQRIQLQSLLSTITFFRKRCGKTIIIPDVAENLAIIEKQLEAGTAVALVLGLSARKLLEALVQQQLFSKRLTSDINNQSLYEGISVLSRYFDPWIMADLNTIRCFGNWMAHATPFAADQIVPRRPVAFNDLLSMLLALERALQQYPWPIQVKNTDRYREINRIRRDKATKII